MLLLYGDVKWAVKVNDYLTPVISVQQGVNYHQLCFFFFFFLYINDLAKEMNPGIDIGDDQLSILMYADDVALIVPDAESLQRMSTKLHDWCSKKRLSVNTEKKLKLFIHSNYTYNTM